MDRHEYYDDFEVKNYTNGFDESYRNPVNLLRPIEFKLTFPILKIMRKIKNIVVPTDFSETARNAFNYAKEFAPRIGATITVANVKEYLLPTSELAITVNPLYSEGETMEAFNNFIADGITNKATQTLKRPIKTQTLGGSPADSLIELSDNKETDLIVIGASGLKDFITRLMGTTSLSVAKNAHCPVLLIPQNTAWQPIKNIMYACNYFSISPKMVKEINDFALLVKAKIHFVHIDDVEKKVEKEADELNWDELFIMTDNKLRFETHYIYGENKIEELKKYVYKNKIDLMTFVSRKKDFWENLFSKSVIQEIAFAGIPKPMLVLHPDD